MEGVPSLVCDWGSIRVKKSDSDERTSQVWNATL
jgi:hypothetical protein